MARLSPKHRPKTHVCAVEFAQLGVVEEDPVYVFVHLFQRDVFVAKNFADEYRPLCQLMSPLLFTRLVRNDSGY